MFPGVDVILGPEMRSTGEVMGIDEDFGIAYAKSQMGASLALPTEGAIFLSVRDADKSAIVPVARQLAEMGFEIYSTRGTCRYLAERGIQTRLLNKIAEGPPNITDLVKDGKIKLLINTPTRKGPETDEGKIRALATMHQIPIVTTVTGAAAAARAIAALRRGRWRVRALQDYFKMADRSARI